MTIKAVLLDLDGTIVNTNELILESFDHTLNKLLGHCPSREELIKTFGKPLTEVFQEMAPEKADELLAEYQNYQQSVDHSQYIKLCPNVREALDRLKAMGLKIALVTSKRTLGAHQNLTQFDLFSYFSTLVTYESTEEHKPTGGPAKKALADLGIAPHEAIMVGDSNLDILCGKDAGTYTAAVSYSAFGKDFLLSFKPDYYIKDLLELADILAK